MQYNFIKIIITHICNIYILLEYGVLKGANGKEEEVVLRKVVKLFKDNKYFK